MRLVENVWKRSLGEVIHKDAFPWRGDLLVEYGQLSRMFRLNDTTEWLNGWVSTEDQAGFIDCHGRAPRNCGKGVDDGQVR